MSTSILSPLSVVISVVAFLLVRIGYRLIFHPLAKFPGPRLAAVTSLYGAYYDLSASRSYVKAISRLHDEYGPIIRTFPNQLHIRDMESYSQIHKAGTAFWKDPSLYTPPFDGSFFNISDPKAMKPRKDLYQAYFSKAAIQRLEWLIHEKFEKFLGVLDVASAQSKSVDLSLGFRCLTTDVVMEYCFQKNFGALDAPDFRFSIILCLDEFIAISPWNWYFPKLVTLITWVAERLPPATVEKYMPALAVTQWIQDQCKERIETLAKETEENTEKRSTPTIFNDALAAKPGVAPTLQELAADAFLMFAAGSDTTGNTLTTATWYILNDNFVLRKLQAELRSAIPKAEKILSSAALEKLPYLRAVVKESLRFSQGVPGKLPRVVPPSGAVFCGMKVPPGTVVSHSTNVYHSSDLYWEDAAKFNPDRWLGNEEHMMAMEKRLLSFSRGSRGCLGINLAYAELYTCLAYLFRRFELTIDGTTAADMEWKDCFVMLTAGHLKVRATRMPE